MTDSVRETGLDIVRFDNEDQNFRDGFFLRRDKNGHRRSCVPVATEFMRQVSLSFRNKLHGLVCSFVEMPIAVLSFLFFAVFGGIESHIEISTYEFWAMPREPGG